ncbi:MAG: polysaccharide deacetylase family protein [Prevotellaceae bacterium]|jgi:peptidoglycan/xylan/chitin deacetylase (PgdA/CDA1 family)|nr:polysaccharide deacetylase family protein [Prevotellaceae bacterium]
MIFISFDIEEFDAPLEYGKPLPFEEQIAISAQGTLAILEVLARRRIVATFFCTAHFAQQQPALIRRIAQEGHEVASHGFYHAAFAPEHLKASKDALEAIAGKPVQGFRMARMMAIGANEIIAAGYRYNSSLNPTFIPGRYNHFRAPRTPFVQNGLLQLPASVTPLLRIPLFWLAMHNLPFCIYKTLCRIAAKRDHYLNIYFHPWEFTDLHAKEKFGLPHYITRHSGQEMLNRLEQLISYLEKCRFPFGCLHRLTETTNE